MISEQEKKDLLQKLLDSQDFKESKRYAELLQFLADRSNRGENLKETTIAHEFFGREVNFDPGKDSFVRSYISGLRKKIEHFYLTTQEPTNFIISIPKGQYNLHFEPAAELPPRLVSRTFQHKYWITALLISVSFAAGIFSYWLLHRPEKSHENVLSNPFIGSFAGGSPKKTIIALGDYFFYTNTIPPPTDRTYFRHPQINSEVDFQNWMRSNPSNAGKYEPLNFTYLRPSTTHGLLSIIHRLGFEEQDYELKMASALKWQDLENSNIIFLGSIKTLYILDTLLLKSNFRYNVSRRKINLINNEGDTLNTIDVPAFRAGGFQEDMSIIVKIPGSGNHSIIVLSGFGEVGIMGSVKIATGDSIVPSIKSNFGATFDKGKQYFSLISRIKGVHQTVFGIKMEAFRYMKTPE